nr:leukocyte elastase inhibitor-like [Penaeus vannamei]
MRSTPFGLDLLQKALPPSGNFFISPFSIWSALVLAYFGSRGKTKAELEQVLRLTNKEDTLALFRALERRYDSQEANQNYTINSANRIYVDQSIPVRECVGKVLDDKLKLIDFNRLKPRAQCESLPYKRADLFSRLTLILSNRDKPSVVIISSTVLLPIKRAFEVLYLELVVPDAAAADINAFVNAETRGKIPKLIEPSSLEDAKMVLTNAVYFKGFWKYPFKPQRTHKEKFFVTPEESVQVDMMTQTGRFKYVDSEKLHAQVLEMPYRGDAVSMVVLLPRSERAKEVDRLVRRLRPRRLVSVLKAMPSVPLIVKFPKISVESTLGMNSFRAIHKALIEVDEEGAEAAAATVLVITNRSSMTPKTTFTCNRPFVFYIKDNEANNILFMGVYRGP